MRSLQDYVTAPYIVLKWHVRLRQTYVRLTRTYVSFPNLLSEVHR
jgi:hypothetical protein